jgi:hypothetical protein
MSAYGPIQPPDPESWHAGWPATAACSADSLLDSGIFATKSAWGKSETRPPLRKMIPVESPNAYCMACELNTVIPNLSRPSFIERWYRLERSKRRLIYRLMTSTS